jgi:hypothetical protein
MRLKRMKKAIALAFFHGGCNQSQIFPRSDGKYTIVAENKKELQDFLIIGKILNLYLRGILRERREGRDEK